MRSLILPGIGVIRRRDPRLALYPFALDDASAGVFRNLMTNVDATLSGGSTLLAQEKFRNDYQRLTSTFPSLGFKTSGAVTNLLYALNADAPSFEGGTVGGWDTYLRCVATVDTTYAWHGVNSMRLTATADNTYAARIDVTAATANAQHTAAVMFRGHIGRVYRIGLGGDVSGVTYGTSVVATGLWQLLTVTHTFAGDAARTLYAMTTSGATLTGEYSNWDSCILVTGATVPQFEESECVVSEAYFANPVPAGAPVSGIVFLWVPYNGNDNTEHNYLDCRDATPLGWRLYKSAANNLLIETTAAAGIKSMGGAVNATNMAAGVMHRIAYALEEDNTQRLALNGTALTTSAGAAGREETVNANLYLGADKDGANHLNGLILPYLYRGVVWGDAECQYYSSLQAPPPRTRMVA